MSSRAVKLAKRCSAGVVSAALLGLFILVAFACSPAYAGTDTPPAPRSVVLGTLTLAGARASGADIIISIGDSVSFRVPANAGYMVYERNDAMGVRRLCIASYNAKGMAFEIFVDTFPLESENFTPLDLLAISTLSAGSRAKTTLSRGIEISGAPGFDYAMQGVSYDRYMAQGEVRTVVLVDLDLCISFTLVEHQPLTAEHRTALDDMTATVKFSTR